MFCLMSKLRPRQKLDLIDFQLYKSIAFAENVVEIYFSASKLKIRIFKIAEFTFKYRLPNLRENKLV